MFTQLKSKYFISVKKEIFYFTTCISIPWFALILMNYFYFLHWHYYFKIFKGGILQCEILKVKQSDTCISFYLRFIWEVKYREFSIWDKWALMLYNMNHFHSCFLSLVNNVIRNIEERHEVKTILLDKGTHNCLQDVCHELNESSDNTNLNAISNWYMFYCMWHSYTWLFIYLLNYLSLFYITKRNCNGLLLIYRL